MFWQYQKERTRERERQSGSCKLIKLSQRRTQKREAGGGVRMRAKGKKGLTR